MARRKLVQDYAGDKSKCKMQNKNKNKMENKNKNKKIKKKLTLGRMTLQHCWLLLLLDSFSTSTLYDDRRQ